MRTFKLCRNENVGRPCYFLTVFVGQLMLLLQNTRFSPAFSKLYRYNPSVDEEVSEKEAREASSVRTKKEREIQIQKAYNATNNRKPNYKGGRGGLQDHTQVMGMISGAAYKIFLKCIFYGVIQPPLVPDNLQYKLIVISIYSVYNINIFPPNINIQ